MAAVLVVNYRYDIRATSLCWPKFVLVSLMKKENANPEKSFVFHLVRIWNDTSQTWSVVSENSFGVRFEPARLSLCALDAPKSTVDQSREEDETTRRAFHISKSSCLILLPELHRKPTPRVKYGEEEFGDGGDAIGRALAGDVGCLIRRGGDSWAVQGGEEAYGGGVPGVAPVETESVAGVLSEGEGRALCGVRLPHHSQIGFPRSGLRG